MKTNYEKVNFNVDLALELKKNIMLKWILLYLVID